MPSEIHPLLAEYKQSIIGYDGLEFHGRHCPCCKRRSELETQISEALAAVPSLERRACQEQSHGQ